MDIRFWLFSCFCLLQLDGGFCACPVEVYRDVTGWGPNCTYRCNCVNNTQCNEETGACQHGCGYGWMGPACQYRNMASINTTTNVYQIPGTFVQTDYASRAVDGDITTCSKTGSSSGRRYWNADFYSPVYIVGLILKINEADAGKFRGFSIEVGNTTGSMETCYKHGANDEGNSNMDISCMKPDVGNRIRIYFKEGETNDLSLCEVEVYGGRLVSFSKPTDAESVLDYNGKWHSYYAVDGRNPKRGENQDSSSVRTCAATVQTPGRRHKWLLVDLNNTYSIQAVSFYGRWERVGQFSGFVVRVGENNETLFTDDPPSTDASFYHPKSRNLTWPVDGRTVRIDRINEYILVVCEIEIFSECTYGKCGWNCEKTCMCSSQTTGIHKVQATCPHGCAWRWTGVNSTCTTECQSHEWGLQCSNVCGHCGQNESCSATNGYCPGSCEPGWKPPMCVDACDSGKYGVNCSEICGYCVDGRICLPVNGTCLNGCADGYSGHDCQSACSTGSFGQNCSKTCGHCLDEKACHHVNGTCTNGCAAGYQGTYCKEFCGHGMFGLNCASRCGKCRNNVTCNKTSGECDSGCAPGWLTTFCNETCDEGFYGDGCQETCGHCFNDTWCVPQTGGCEKGCAAGYHGTVCKTPCENGKFGENCRLECGKCSGYDPCNATNGMCAQGCLDGYSGDFCQENQVPNGDNQTTIIGAVVGSVVVVTVVILAVVVVLKRRQKGKGGSSKKKEETVFSNKALVEEADSLTKLHSDPPAQNASEVEYKNVQDVAKAPSKTIPVNALRNVCLAAQRNPDFLYKDFQELPYGLHGDASEARNPDNKPKNRYKEMYPYNATRVHLPEIPGRPSSTYINASYIDGYFHPQQYIAAQGALKTTINDIWRMIWSENIETIVMVTNCVEAGKLKCEQYWPDNDSNVFGDISVELKSTKEYADFKIRTFSCTSTQSNAKRRVTQFHYTAWPDKDVPDTALSIVQFWRVVRDHESANLKERRPPMLVHCSAGVGRTGTFIATDVLYDQGKAENSVNIKEAVYRLRQQRLNLVQTKEQYVLLHDMLAEILDPIGTVCSCDEFPAIYSTLVSDKAINKQQLFQEYQQVCKACEEVLHDTDEGAVYGNIGAQVLKGCDSAKRPENLMKSRDPGILPEDADRPLLNMEVRGCNDFINAVYLSTYRHQDRMILTQCPLENTVVDFIRMIWQYRITDVVLLEQEMLSQEETYWPTRENPKTVGPFVIELLSEQSQDVFIFRTLVLSVKGKSEHIEFRQYHYQAWPEKKEIPVDTGSILHLISAVEQNEMMQLVVQCLDGAKRSGVFCVIYSLLERLKLDGQVAVAETVRMAKVKRRQIIDNYEQYKYCYDVVNYCLQTSNVYANV